VIASPKGDEQSKPFFRMQGKEKGASPRKTHDEADQNI
jgi:hypothetical protein